MTNVHMIVGSIVVVLYVVNLAMYALTFFRGKPVAYHRGFCNGRDFFTGKSYYGIELPLGQPAGGPLFFAHYSFMALDPRGLRDRYADYWTQCERHVQINRAHCLANQLCTPCFTTCADNDRLMMNEHTMKNWTA